MKTLKLIILAAFLVVCVASLFGCETLDDGLDEKPWSEREPWEDNLGVPF